MLKNLPTLLVIACFTLSIAADGPARDRVTIQNGEWKFIGDLTLPKAPGKGPAVLMLNKAAGDRSVYGDLSAQLAARGIAPLALDMRGHGESTNVEHFIAGT